MVMKSIHQVSIGWEDEEGDLVTVSTDEELAHALQCKRRCNKFSKGIIMFLVLSDRGRVMRTPLDCSDLRSHWWKTHGGYRSSL